MNTLPDSPSAPASSADASTSSRAAARTGQPSRALRDPGFIALLLQHMTEGSETAAPQALPDLPPSEAVSEQERKEHMAPGTGDAFRGDPFLPILPLHAHPPLKEAFLPGRSSPGVLPMRDMVTELARSSSAGIAIDHRNAAADFSGVSPAPVAEPASAASPARAANIASAGKIFPFLAVEGGAGLPARPDLPAEPVSLMQTIPAGSTPVVALPHAVSPTLAAGVSPMQPGVHTPLGASGWHSEFAQQVVWMATHQQQTAELRLNPPHLGPVEITLTLNHDRGIEASVQFASPHAAVREAIEASLPRLREQFAESGIAMGNVTVSAESFRERKQDEGPDHRSSGSLPAVAEPVAIHSSADASSSVLPARRGLVDTFA